MIEPWRTQVRARREPGRALPCYAGRGAWRLPLTCAGFLPGRRGWAPASVLPHESLLLGEIQSWGTELPGPQRAGKHLSRFAARRLSRGSDLESGPLNADPWMPTPGGPAPPRPGPLRGVSWGSRRVRASPAFFLPCERPTSQLCLTFMALVIECRVWAAVSL